MPTNSAIQALRERLAGVATDFEEEDVDAVEGILHFRLATDETEQEYMKPSSAIYVVNGRVGEFDIRIGQYDIETVREAASNVSHQPPHTVTEGHGIGAPPHIRAYNVDADIATLARFLHGLVRELQEAI